MKSIGKDYTKEEGSKANEQSKGKAYKRDREPKEAYKRARVKQRYCIGTYKSFAGRNSAKKKAFYIKAYFLPPYNRIEKGDP